jgi:uncharacterized Zn-binding protein involved in type VI secretion
VGAPAVVMGDKINGTCPNHQIPSASGTAPAGPLPFSAPIVQNIAGTVFIGGKLAVMANSFGFNTPPHPGIVDPPYATPNMQVGRVLTGSATVLIEGRMAATLQSNATCCTVKATAIAPGVATVLIG